MIQNSMKFTKERLKDSDLLPRTFRSRDGLSGVILDFYVKDYDKLKNNVIYYISAKMCEYTWTCKLVIVNETLFTFMSSSANLKNPTIFIYKAHGYCATNFSSALNERFTISKFCHKAIVDPKYKYLDGGTLLIEYKYELEQPKTYHYSTNYGSLQTLIDSAEYTDDFKHLFLLTYVPDLSLNVRGKIYLCHKNILARVSKVLANFFQKHNLLPNQRHLIAIDEEPNFLEHVVAYIYTGRLHKLDENTMIEVYRIANILNIDMLENKCMEYFQTNLSPSNEMHILELATRYRLKELKNAAVRYMVGRGSNLLRSSVCLKL